jgi:hypothetical protein
MKHGQYMMMVFWVFGVFMIAYFLLPAEPQSDGGCDNVEFSCSVRGCAETENGLATRGADEAERGPSIMISGNQVTYSRAINHLCCRKAVIQKDISPGRIDIYEVWSGLGCRCMCFSEMEATVKGLPAGRYSVNVYEQGTTPEGNPMERSVVVSRDVWIR